MGQKVSPTLFRLNYNVNWHSRWYDKKKYAHNLYHDHLIRSFLHKKYAYQGLSKVIIERPASKVLVSIYTSRPGLIIGKKGQDLEMIKKQISSLTDQEVSFNVIEEKKPDLDPLIVASSIALQIEKRASHKRAMKKAIQATMKSGAKGIRILVSGRLNGAEIARSEEYLEGRVPLHTLRAKVEYGASTAKTTYGIIGVKVWIYATDQTSYTSIKKPTLPKAKRS